MQAVVIYDSQGNPWNITYGDNVTKPEMLKAARLEIPDGYQLTGVDISNPDDPQPVFESIPASDYTNLQNQIKDIELKYEIESEMKKEFDVEMDYRISMMELNV